MSKNPQGPQLPKELSRKHVSRAERDARKTRILLLTVGGALVLAIALIGFGLFRDSVLVPNEPVAKVGDQVLTTREFWARVRLERYQLVNQYNFYTSVQLPDQAAQALQQLNLSNALTIGSQTINQMIDEALYRQAAPELGVTVSEDELNKSIEEAFGYYRQTPTPEPTRTPRPTLTPSPTLTGTAPITITPTPAPTITPAPTATPVTLEGYQELFGDRVTELSALGFADADYRRLWETQLIAQKVRDVVLTGVLTTTEQAQFRYIRAVTQADMDAVQQAIAADGFDAVYGQVLSQTFTLTSVQAIDFPYAPKFDLEDSGQYGTVFGTPFADSVFSAPVGGTFGVITNTAGNLYYLGQVMDRGVRALLPDAFERAQAKALQDWLNQRRQSVTVEVYQWEDRVPVDPMP